jgi:hypothetical protein
MRRGGLAVASSSGARLTTAPRTFTLLASIYIEQRPIELRGQEALTVRPRTANVPLICLTVAALTSCAGSPSSSTVAGSGTPSGSPLPATSPAQQSVPSTAAAPTMAAATTRSAPSAEAVVGPQALVRDYVAAVNRYDESAAFALMTPDYAMQVRSQVDGLANVVSITDLVVSAPRTAGGPGTRAAAYHEAVFVPVTFTLHQRQVVSMPDGHHAWGYLLVRNRSTEPWRINDEGPV